jgi:carboxyl-terminal processing protease
MSMRKKTFILILVLAAASLACQTATRFLTPIDDSPTPRPTSTIAPTFPPDYTPPAPTPTSTLVPLSKNEQLEIFDQLWTVVHEEYLYDDFNGVDWDAAYDEYVSLIEEGLATDQFYFELDMLIYSLGDDHSVYLDPQYVAWEDAEYESGNDYVGIGIWLEAVEERERVVVLLTFPGSPADRAGIRSRDSILSIEGRPVLTEDGDNLDLLTGAAGSSVTLTVQSPGEEPRQLTVNRDRIVGSLPVPSHLFTSPGGKKIGYLLIPTFSDSSIAIQVGQALDDLGQQADLDGLIIDNRMNSGGYDTVMADTLGYFASGVVGHFSNREGDTPLRVTRRNVNGSAELPLVVLVGEGTASFAEIFSGILQDQGRATVVGETTLGNVEILWGYDFDDGSRAWIAHDTFIPANNPEVNWEKNGVVPTFTVEAPWDLFAFEDDPAIQFAVEYLD